MDLKSADRSHNTTVMVAHPTYTAMVNPVAIPVTGPLYGNGQSSPITLETTAQAQAALGTFSQYGLLTSPTTTSVGSLLPSSWTTGHTFVPVYQPSGSAIAPTIVDLGSYIGTNVTAASPIVATPSITGVSLSCPTCGTSSGGTNVSVNGGSSLGNLNINATSPVADASYLAMTPKVSGSDMITEVPYATSSQYGVTLLGATGGADVYGAAAARQANLSLLPGTYTNGDMCTYASTGTLLNCNTAIPTVGTWGALNYPTWASGTPFVKMTAAGTFALDTNTYLTSLSGALLATGATTGATSQAQVFTDGVTLSNLSSYSGNLASIGSGGALSNSGIAASNVPLLNAANTFTATNTFNNATYSALFTGGPVGIGTTAPGQKLEVNGSALVDTYLSVGGAQLSFMGDGQLSVPTGINLGTGSNGPLYEFTSNSVEGYIRANTYYNGSVNIRSTSGYSPQLHLDINDGTIGFSTGGTGSAGATISQTDRMVILDNGNVGIGTVSPTYKLTVAKDSNSNFIGFNDDGATSVYNWIGTNANHSLLFNTYDTSNHMAMSIINNGNVGIETTSPTHTLEVNGTFQSGTATLGASSTASNGSTQQAICLADGTECPSTTAAISGMTTGQLPVAASATTVTSSIAYATANTASTIVERDGSGNFSAGTITATLNGTASGNVTPTTLDNDTLPVSATTLTTSGAATLGAGSTVNSTAICLADGTNCPATFSNGGTAGCSISGQIAWKRITPAAGGSPLYNKNIFGYITGFPCVGTFTLSFSPSYTGSQGVFYSSDLSTGVTVTSLSTSSVTLTSSTGWAAGTVVIEGW